MVAFSQDKTRITHLDQGVGFPGFEIRRFGGKLLTKPGRDALRQIRNRLFAEVTAIKRPLSRYVYKSLRTDRRTDKATISIDTLTIPLSP